MIIKTFTTIDETYEKGVICDKKVLYFSTEDLRDDYFINVMRELYLEQDWPEPQDNVFGIGQWTHRLKKGQEELVIINIKTW